MIDALVVPAFNRVLRRNSWALRELQPFCGHTARFELPLVTLAVTIAETGELSLAVPMTAPRVTFVVTPGQMLRILARDDTVLNEIAVNGDTDLAAALDRIWRQLRWDIEEDLAGVFGDIAAHRIVMAGTTLDRWRAQSFDGIAHSFAEYWTEEQPLIARTQDIAQFNSDVDRLRDDADRLEKRLQLLDKLLER